MRSALALLLLVAAPASGAPGERIHRLNDLLHEWRLGEATSELALLARERPGDAETAFLDGHLRFLRGDYPGALERLKTALDKGRGRGDLDDWRFLRELAATTEEATRGFVEVRSPEGHFVIRHAPGRDGILPAYAFEALEAAYREIAQRDFGDAPSEPVRVEIFPEVADLARVSTLTRKEIETSGTIAICKWNRLMIVSPRALARGYPWLDTLAHELTHFVVTRTSRNRVPIWLHEGLAKFEEERWRRAEPSPLSPTSEHILAVALKRGGRLISFAEMHPSMAKLPSQADTALAFAEVQSAVAYLHERVGWSGVREIVARLREGRSEGAAVAAALGGSFADFERDFRTWLRGRKLRERPGLLPPSLKFIKAGAKARSDEDDAQEITEERARRFARLGGLLRARGRLGPAAVEYEKAQALLGPGHPAVAGKLARTYLELGDADRAIAAAEPGAELYPDHGAFHTTLGAAWLKKRRPDRAIPALEAALRINPFDPSPHCALAGLYGERSDPRAGREREACRALAEEP